MVPDYMFNRSTAAARRPLTVCHLAVEAGVRLPIRDRREPVLSDSDRHPFSEPGRTSWLPPEADDNELRGLGQRTTRADLN